MPYPIAARVAGTLRPDDHDTHTHTHRSDGRPRGRARDRRSRVRRGRRRVRRRGDRRRVREPLRPHPGRRLEHRRPVHDARRRALPAGELRRADHGRRLRHRRRLRALLRRRDRLSNASRQIEDDEKAACEQKGVEYAEFQVANDALTVIVNKENDWATCLTTEELKKIWEPDSKVTNWNQVRSDFPDQELKLFGPGTDSGHVRLLHRRDQRRGGRQPHRLLRRARTTT